MAAVTELWRRGECGEDHEFEDDARECCAPRISEVWRCDGCCETHDTEADALACCPDQPESDFPMASMIERERAGKRLDAGR